jgi:hypothetical protein
MQNPPSVKLERIVAIPAPAWQGKSARGDDSGVRLQLASAQPTHP